MSEDSARFCSRYNVTYRFKDEPNVKVATVAIVGGYTTFESIRKILAVKRGCEIEDFKIMAVFLIWEGPQ